MLITRRPKVAQSALQLLRRSSQSPPPVERQKPDMASINRETRALTKQFQKDPQANPFHFPYNPFPNAELGLTRSEIQWGKQRQQLHTLRQQRLEQDLEEALADSMPKP